MISTTHSVSTTDFNKKNAPTMEFPIKNVSCGDLLNTI